MDLFKIGFVNITLLDFIDIAIVAMIIYYLYEAIRGTVASQIFLGLVLVLVLSYTAQIMNLRALSLILRLFTDIWIIFFVVVFQPDIRQLLLKVSNKLFRIRIKTDSPASVTAIVDAAFALSQLQHGALIVIIKSSGSRAFIDTGEILNANVSKNLICSIFYPRSPLHDGAIIIRQDIIESARCVLPTTLQNKYPNEVLGLRHKAGLGASEQAEVLAIIVSEETGSISVAERGILERGIAREELKRKLIEIYGVKSLNTETRKAGD